MKGIYSNHRQRIHHPDTINREMAHEAEKSGLYFSSDKLSGHPGTLNSPQISSSSLPVLPGDRRFLFFFLLCIQHQWLSRVTRPSPAEACRPHSSGDYIHPSRREGRDAGQKEWASSGEGGVEGSRKGVSNREHPNEHRQELEDSTAGKGEGKQSYTLLYKIGQQGIRLICCGAWK